MGIASYIKEDDALIAILEANKKWQCAQASQRKQSTYLLSITGTKHIHKICKKEIRMENYEDHKRCCYLLWKRDQEFGNKNYDGDIVFQN